jgi:hypothetical protein
MEKRVRKFSSKEAAEAADRAYYLSLTPQQRMEILFTLNQRQPGASEGFKRVCRVVKRPPR